MGLREVWCCSLVIALAAACSPRASTVNGTDIVDPEEPAYGKTYAQWAVEWMKYYYAPAPPVCSNPFVDASGADCTLYQDPSSPVFFLVGNFGGVSQRDACPVPSGKALFFPIASASADNSGLPADSRATQAELHDYVEQMTGNHGSLELVVDGEPIADLDRGRVPPTEYVVILERGKNPYACADLPDVEGEFHGYVAGNWALLPPLAPGRHSIRFGFGTSSATPIVDTQVHVEYTFTLEPAD
jgi:hypothetical protein